MLHYFTLLFIGILALATGVAAQQCSETVPCSVGCCSKFGYCGFGDDFCGTGCKNSCTAQKQCDQNRPCDIGCCSRFGFCGLGQDFCGADCAFQCDRKAQCDPGGWGAKYVNNTKCPLNVCCSKFGFCGMTSEFCGDKVVKHQTCDVSTQPIKRVIGYYEGWAPIRSCHRMNPENIPLGVYTHINFAFASVGEPSFQTIPSSTDGIELWKRVMMLKQSDPNVKIWLAIGGWTFNDPDQITRTTFSDIVSSKANQDKFITGLVLLMTSFGFDGVDIDWEYPGAPERSGRSEDFVNFPVFIGRLRKALKNANSNWGISVTLPASFWYLQHFDIVKLEENVDWFNMMSYDMHGAWDLTTDWGKIHGAQVNPHTNLTEISDGLDLLWRNNIDPAKVTMGLAFYGRSMTLASTSCSHPGCPVVSAGDAGPCSDAAGVLLNTEIADIIAEHNLTPTLDKAAAVKMITWGNQWTSFDDGDTFKIKGDFAKAHCMGGVMVWAASHDNINGDNAVALANALGRPVSIPTTHEAQMDTTNPQAEFCRWVNCGETCPEGFNTLLRQDETSQLMLTSQGCPYGSNTVHTLCCPKKELTFCQWRGFKNSGHCSGGCSSKEVEVGTTNAGCSKGYQSACCTLNPTTEPYGECKWFGDSPNCPTGDPQTTCPGDYPKFVVASNVGFGGEPYCQTGKRAFCCKGPEIPKPFQNCKWYGHQTNLLKTDVAVLCEDSCPPDNILIAKNFGGPSDELSCLATYPAFCCAGVPEVIERSGDDANLEEFKYYLSTFMMDPTCPAGAYSELTKRAGHGISDAPTSASSISSTLSTSDLRKRQAMDQTRFTNLVNIMSYFFFATHQDVNKVNFFDSYMVGTDRMLPSDSLVRDFLYPRGADIANVGPTVDPSEFTADFLCNVYSARDAIDESNTARGELCEYPSGPRARTRDASPLDESDVREELDRLVRRGLRNDSNGDSDLYGPLSEELVDLWKRRFEAFDSSNRGTSDSPSVRLALEGVLNGDLTLHYARWLRSRHVVDTEVILEVAYWIGPSVGTAPSTAVRDRYRQNSHTNPEDRWVVFHLHIPIGPRTFRRPTGGGTGARDFRVGVATLAVFHGQRVVYYNDIDPHVDGRMTRDERDSEGNDVNFGQGAYYNDRTTVFNCPIQSANTGLWYIGDTESPSLSRWGQTLVDFGNHLFTAGIADMDSLSYVWTDQRGDPTPDGQPMNQRTFRPTADAFDAVWLGHGVQPHSLNIPGVPTVNGGWYYGN